MGILAKIISESEQDNLSATIEKKSGPENISPADLSGRPSAPCQNKHSGPTPPYGLHHWRDNYGNWHCTQCDPPATLSMVREEFLVVPGCGGVRPERPNDTREDFILAPGFEITAIRSADGKVLWSPATTQAERRQIVNDWEWFDRQDARRAAKNAKSGHCLTMEAKTRHKDSD